MSTHTDDGGQSHTSFPSRKVVIWASWDVDFSAFNSVVTTFVFFAYLTTPKLSRPSVDANLDWTTALAGILVVLAVLALGQRADRTGKTHTVLMTTTFALATLISAMFFVRPSERYVWLGLPLLAANNFVLGIGSVIYNLMISNISTPENVGRASSFDWGLGYIGPILLLFFLLVGFVQPKAGLFGVTGEDALNIRVSMVMCVLWTLAFHLPLLLASRSHLPSDKPSCGLLGSHADLGRSITRLWRESRSVVRFLVSSAIYRDGLAGVFIFGEVLAGVALGLKREEVIMPGVAANLVADIVTVAFGQLDDRIDPRKVIVGSSTSVCVPALIVLFGKPAGPVALWVFDLALCAFVGPTQTASRSYPARVALSGSETEMFGLYAMTGRTVSFLSSVMYSSPITLASRVSDRPRNGVAIYGILGIVVILLIGLATLTPVRLETETSE